MFQHFRVNVGQNWTFAIDEATLVGSLVGPNGSSPDEPSFLLREAVARPLDFPSLNCASVPGDRIAIAVDGLLPDPQAAVRGVLAALSPGGDGPDQVSLLLPPSLAEAAEDLARDEALLRLDVRTIVHDPADRQEMAYLAATSDGRPIYLNRLLCDADMVIPLTCVPPPFNPRWLGIHGSVFPAFSEAEAIDRYRISRDWLSENRSELRHKEVDEVGWLLGISFVVGVVPGRDGTILQAVAGTPAMVSEHCLAVAEREWRLECPHRVPLVIALVGDRPGPLAWDDFAAALAAARQVAGDDAAVAVCGNFTRRPGRSLHRLVDATDLPAVEHRLQGDQHEDTWAAQELAAALQRGPVYFAGPLRDEQVEGLGMAPIQRPEELARLASHFHECVVIRDAQIALPCLRDESRPAA